MWALVCLLLTSFSSSFRQSLALDWSYSGATGPQHWGKIYPNCSVKGQSPRNINLGETVYDKTLPQLKFEDYDRFHHLVQENKLHMIQLRVKHIGRSGRVFIGGEFNATYIASEVHFHWGDETSEGSEHQFNAKKFPAEVHIVHFNSKYNDLATASSKSDGVAVLSVLVDVEIERNIAFGTVVYNLPHTEYTGDSVQNFALLLDKFLPEDTQKYFHYHVTFTTPPCSPTVCWFIFKERIPISEQQLGYLRAVVDAPAGTVPAKRMGDNFRPIAAELVSSEPVRRSFDSPVCDTDKSIGYTVLCSTTAEGKSVNYALTLNRCILPNSATLQITIPADNFTLTRTTFVDIQDPAIKLGSLDYQVRLEFHDHIWGKNSGKIHFTLYQERISNRSEKLTVLEKYFKVDPCSQAKCNKVTEKMYSCQHLVQDDMDVMNRTFVPEVVGCSPLKVKLSIKDPAGKIISSKIFEEKEKAVMSLQSDTTTSVAKRFNLETASFILMTSKNDGTTNVQFYIMSAGEPASTKFKVLDVPFTQSSICPPGTVQVSSNKKITVGIAIVLIILTLIGLAGVLFWRRYRSEYREPALVGEMEIDGDGDMSVSFR